MEVLVEVLSHSLALLAIPLIVLAVELIVVVILAITAVLRLVWLRIRSGHRAVQRFYDESSGKWATLRRRFFLAMVGFFISGLFAVLFLAIFVSASVEMLMAVVSVRTGIKIEIGEISGSWFRGNLDLGNLKFQRRDHPTTDFEIEIDRVQLSFDLSSVLDSQVRIHSLKIIKPTGFIIRKALEKKNGARIVKPFSIATLELLDGRIKLSERTNRRVDIPLSISRFSASNVASSHLWYQLLFASRLSGTFGGATVSIAPRATDAKATKIVIEGIELSTFKRFISKPLNWLVAGKLTVIATDGGIIGPNGQRLLTTRFRFDKLNVRLPRKNSDNVSRRVAKRLVQRFIRARRFRFTTKTNIDRTMFNSHSSFGPPNLYRAMSRGMILHLQRLVKRRKKR